MPTLPSGRRVEFSIDRFTAMLHQMPAAQAACICDALIDPDDLMHVLDIVLFKPDNDQPYFAGQVLSQWTALAATWDSSDRQAFYDYLGSGLSRASRAEAMAALKESVMVASAANGGSAESDVAAHENLLHAA